MQKAIVERKILVKNYSSFVVFYTHQEFDNFRYPLPEVSKFWNFLYDSHDMLLVQAIFPLQFCSFLMPSIQQSTDLLFR